MKKYDVIARDLSTMISSMSAGDRIPSEQELAAKYSVSSMTIRRALQVLHGSGRIQGIPGRGTFVVDPHLSKPLTSSSFSETMRLAGQVASSKLMSASIQASTDQERAYLELNDSAKVLHIKRIRLGDGTPLCVEHARLSAERFPGLLGVDLEQSLYAALSARYGILISRSQFEVYAILPDAETTEMLEIDATIPCLETISISRDQEGQVVEWSRSIYRGDRYSLTFQPESAVAT